MIAPFFDLLDIPGRDYVKLGDFNQIEQKLHRRLRQKLKTPAQRHSAYLERRYLALIKLVRRELTPKMKMSKVELSTRIDALLRGQGLCLRPGEAQQCLHQSIYQQKPS